MGVRIRVRGQVQGVGFRPFVWQLAQRLGVRGEVLNDPEGVLILAEGGDLDALARALSAEAPPLARVDAVEVGPHAFGAAPEGFVIAASQGQGAETRVTPDAATCPDCLAEVLDPVERRHRYPFTNCTHCGPRYTILTGLPYDRARTTMAAFPLCADCAAEYADPADRRFHAQPVACPACGPHAWMEEDGREVPGEAVRLAADRLRSGRIVAVKGLGGFHLACDATDAGAVQRLRDRKRRPTKPFALMAPLEVIRRHALVSEAEEALLRDPAAPIVLLARAGEALPEALAPGLDALGWMLPATPLHHLLLREAGRPLVMTSGNLSGEPMVTGNEEARDKLLAFADALLLHDRDIARRLDDGVERVGAAGPMVLRRARGRVPGTLRLPEGFADAPQVAAYGGQMKAAVCLLKNGQAMLSQHLGDLDDAATWDGWVQAIADGTALFDHRPVAVACDLHPDFRASRHAAESGLPVMAVQHHHAHLASCLADAGCPLNGGSVAGIVLDGLGLGTDGTVWGGEVLLGGYLDAERAAWLRPAPLPGGDAASREPWRNLLARLDQAGLPDLADRMLAGRPVAALRAAIAAGVNAPLSSSAGRLFDAVAAALGLAVGRQGYEGEAAMRLEALAARSEDPGAYPFGAGPEIDPAPMFQALARDLGAGTAPEAIAARFHRGLAQAFASSARRLVEGGRAGAVALSGGCLQNATLLARLLEALEGLPVLTHRAAPANDGGLALGQAAVAAARLLHGAESA